MQMAVDATCFLCNKMIATKRATVHLQGEVSTVPHSAPQQASERDPVDASGSVSSGSSSGEPVERACDSETRSGQQVRKASSFFSVLQYSLHFDTLYRKLTPPFH